MAKIKNESRWGRDKARERYQFGGALPDQANPAAAAAMANRPAMPAMAPAQAGLPAQAAPQAAAALAARPALPAQAMGQRPFAKGGIVDDEGLTEGAKTPKGGSGPHWNPKLYGGARAPKSTRVPPDEIESPSGYSTTKPKGTTPPDDYNYKRGGKKVGRK